MTEALELNEEVVARFERNCRNMDIYLVVFRKSIYEMPGRY